MFPRSGPTGSTCKVSGAQGPLEVGVKVLLEANFQLISGGTGAARIGSVKRGIIARVDVCPCSLIRLLQKVQVPTWPRYLNLMRSGCY
jgi:hypothetical protein